MENILVIGANGKTGRIVSKILRDSNKYTTYAMIRNEVQQNYFENQGIKTRIGDLEKDFSDAFKGMDKVIFAAGSGGSTGDEKTIAVDQKGAIRAIELAKAHKLQKFVMLSSMGTDDPSQMKGLELYLRAKKAADDFLRESQMPYTIVQPGALTDDKGADKVEIAQKLNKSGKISREDVAYALVLSLNLETAKNKSFELLTGNQDLEKALKTF
ncbi:SDR family oxidoreductase [Psychroflexus aestuariivivens]|uniref:SDR family oxidoreductase n=1 Tax=Psychroflexus aestuariivivens TaxID=1795040 RepID=UPI000FDC8D13|nr:SDR family oxidoreductase [Psychroflexus aestuariivivens]